jgi:hypothetical protein
MFLNVSDTCEHSVEAKSILKVSDTGGATNIDEVLHWAK